MCDLKKVSHQKKNHHTRKNYVVILDTEYNKKYNIMFVTRNTIRKKTLRNTQHTQATPKRSLDLGSMERPCMPTVWDLGSSKGS
jgi:hypothetical protein